MLNIFYTVFKLAWLIRLPYGGIIFLKVLNSIDKSAC